MIILRLSQGAAAYIGSADARSPLQVSTITEMPKAARSDADIRTTEGFIDWI